MANIIEQPEFTEFIKEIKAKILHSQCKVLTVIHKELNPIKILKGWLV